MRSIDQDFYESKAWRRCRELYKKQQPFCERCLSQGLYVPGDIVHHKIHLTEDNYRDASISLNPENLENLCRACHNKEHARPSQPKRWKFLNGELIMTELPESGTPPIS